MSALASIFGAGVIVLWAVIMIAFPADFINRANAGTKPNSWRRVRVGVAGTRALGIGILAIVALVTVCALLRD